MRFYAMVLPPAPFASIESPHLVQLLSKSGIEPKFEDGVEATISNFIITS